VAVAVAGLVLALMVLVVVRLPWAGDLGMHAATVQRLRHSPFAPGNPLVDADTPSPYYSPWMLLLGTVARVPGLSVFVVLRLAAAAGLALLVTGVWRYARTLSAHRAAPALALLSLLLLWGTTPFLWSGFPGLNSLALTVSYPSTFTLGLAFHFWAWLTGALRRGAGWPAWLGLGTLWAVILLCHQFSGVVATVGAAATVLAARTGRAVWPRLGAGLLVGAVVLWAWPYYDFFALFGAGTGLERVHRVLYGHPVARFGLVLLGVAALVPRARRDRRDPLVLFFGLGALVVAAGWLSGHYSWGRALPAALIPAQFAAALEAVGAGRRRLRAGWTALLAGALLLGGWTQVGTLGYVVPRGALPAAVEDRHRVPWTGYHWITPWVRYGDVVMAEGRAARQVPAYGFYTVAPGYPDFFLPDEERRVAATGVYFAEGTSSSVRRGIEREYGVRWVVDGGGVLDGAGLRVVARGPKGQVLYAVP
jgi:alpha-1,6-mannosyltransferase